MKQAIQQEYPVKVILLGTGGPQIDPDRMGPATLVNTQGKNYLFDAGRGASIQLARAGIESGELDAIFITHHHFDHLSSLDDILFSAWNGGRVDPLPIYGPPGTALIVDTLIGNIYKNDIRFRETEASLTGKVLSNIREIIHAVDIEDGVTYQKYGTTIACNRVEHGHGLGISQTHWCCLGYRIESADRVVTISGDTVDCPGLQTLSNGADLLVQCCYLAEAEIIDKEHQIIAKHILASSGMAGKIAAKAGVKAIALTHLRRKSEELLQNVESDVKQAFHGEVFVGKDLLEIIV